jgi:putative spermidine/putrescine transport system ATP-binding protein
MPYLELNHLEKSFGATRVVKDFSLNIEKGEFISLLGPSGCGKTTVLRMVAGFETPTAGSIEIEGKDVVPLRPSQRNVGMVFQSYALFPNLTVVQNVAFGLRVAGMAKAETVDRVSEMLGLIGLRDLGDRYPFQLSGGQQQRVALARALAVRPRVLLLDEPLSALDAKIRVSLRAEIRAIQRDLGITTIFVTHDQEEALTMSDRVVVMNGGIAEQAGSPHEVYNRPMTRFVANFVGTLNSFGAIVADRSAGLVDLDGIKVKLNPHKLAGCKNGDKITLALRPEAMRLGRGGAGDIVVPASVEEVHFMGSVIRLRARAAGITISLDTFNRPELPPPQVGSLAEVSFSAQNLIIIAA